MHKALGLNILSVRHKSDRCKWTSGTVTINASGSSQIGWARPVQVYGRLGSQEDKTIGMLGVDVDLL